MIVFDLRCGAGHVFEAWFGSSAAFEEQRARALVRCPVCDDAAVTKAAMAFNISAKANQVPAVPAPADAKAMLAALAQAQAALLENSEWVGAAFADRARAMHHGDTPQTAIHGQATLSEAQDLIADGVLVAPLPLPVVPPTLRN